MPGEAGGVKVVWGVHEDVGGAVFFDPLGDDGGPFGEEGEVFFDSGVANKAHEGVWAGGDEADWDFVFFALGFEAGGVIKFGIVEAAGVKDDAVYFVGNEDVVEGGFGTGEEGGVADFDGVGKVIGESTEVIV